MTRDEINKKISELRDECPEECGYEWSAFSPITGTNSAHHMHRCVEPWTHTRTSGVMDWESDHHCMCGVNRKSHSYEHVAVKDWHLDVNWPTLLRELLHGDSMFTLEALGGHAAAISFCSYAHEFDLDAMGRAVSLAWLQWKQHH